MTAVDRDPVTLAREVLDLTHEDETVTVCSVPDNKAAALARAVIDLTAKVERGEALADLLDDEANRMGSRGGAFTARAFASEIRNALNGDDA